MEPTRPSQVRTGYKQGADHASAHFLCWAGAHLKEDHGDEHSPEAVDHNCCDKDMVAAKRWTKLVRNSGTAGMASALIDAATTANSHILGKIWIAFCGTSRPRRQNPKPPLYYCGYPRHHGVMNTRARLTAGTWAAGGQGDISGLAVEAVSS